MTVTDTPLGARIVLCPWASKPYTIEVTYGHNRWISKAFRSTRWGAERAARALLKGEVVLAEFTSAAAIPPGSQAAHP